MNRTGLEKEIVQGWLSQSEDLLNRFYAEEALRRKLIDGIVPCDFRLFSPRK
jgi:hypothetical protein